MKEKTKKYIGKIEGKNERRQNEEFSRKIERENEGYALGQIKCKRRRKQRNTLGQVKREDVYDFILLLL